MARPPQGQPHPGRQLAVLGLLFAILYALVFWGPGTKGLGYEERLHPRLGLDLIGGTQATYVASLANGQAPSRESMEESRKIIDQRVNALGVAEAEVVVEGNRNIVVSVAGEANDQLKTVGQAAQMRFRKVVKVTGDSAAVAANPPTAAPSAAPSGAASPKPSTSVKATKAPAVTGSSAPSAGTGGQGGGERAPAPSASASAPAAAPSAPAPAPSPSASTPAPVSADVKEQRAAIAKKVGAAAWAAAEKLTDPVDLSTNPAAGLPYKAFGTLSGEEVNALTPEMQFNVPTIGCDQLNKRTAGAIDDEKSKVVACQSGAKMMLDVAKVVGTDIDTATPQLDQTTGQWVVSLDFTSSGQSKWTELTREAFQPAANDSCLSAAQAMSTGATHCLVAVVLDKEVISAPEIQGVLSGQSQITGQFNATSAKELADKIKYGALPVTFDPGTTQTVSATLGIAQLKAGLIAAAIGMGLVAIYAFFYYRLLGSVIFLSLLLSGLLTFGALVVLGRTTGFTLTLAGIAGFIVSLGVAADSFVIYFERLKDEIHEGRSARSAVPRAWARARRTIISANTITIMAAVVLYIVSIGAVKGFAFALGLSTILDLIVVFLFRHPIMTMFANTKAFLSPRVSGLGRALKRAPTEKEA
ncbi:protein translocase subunit SecD [Couchioplanes caeruleus]|uniref:Protein translocase subunit SecD n=2 Tax=Couchioplanes caeruleus TaxID=56438 RepID=A0A1K0FLD0_9ACTN|nr:protein translocase subunit SecD [Couchioplanes caeruleus]OJF13536.1 protein-export membrane protein SecD [Couchioplanes caeruleus subsp. caeruleus]ROP33247.1 preprotein translocase subunit SecD [Couchioplanes caeruleus]